MPSHRLRAIISLFCRLRCGLLTLSVCLLFPSIGNARHVFSPTDPAFTGIVTVQLPPTPIPSGAASFQFVSNGVTFLFEKLDGGFLTGVTAIGVVPTFPSFLGVRVTITPAVTALGFSWQEFDGCASATFTSTLTVTEEVVTVPRPCQPFFGAADIGAISSVVLPATPAGSNAFGLTEMQFVPPPPPPVGGGPPGVRTEAVAGTDDPPTVDTDGDPGTAEAADTNVSITGRPPGVSTSRARAELNAGFALRKVQSVSSTCFHFSEPFALGTAMSEERAR